MNYLVYVIQSAEGYRYIGQSSDLDRRLAEHNSGASHSTRHGSNWQIVYQEQFESRGDAMKREKYFKTGAGRDFLKRQIRGVESAVAE